MTLEENDMQASRWAKNRDCILSERLSILNLANGQSVTLKNRRIFTSKMAHEKYNCVLIIKSPMPISISMISLTMLFFRSFLFNLTIGISKCII